MVLSSYFKFLPLILFLVCNEDKLPNENEPKPHPCSDSVHVEVRAVMPNCDGKDGSIIIENPRGSNVTYQWSHDSNETGYNVGDLDAGIYEITIVKSGQVRKVKVLLE